LSLGAFERGFKRRPWLSGLVGLALAAFATVRAVYLWVLQDATKGEAVSMSVSALVGDAAPKLVIPEDGVLAPPRAERKQRRIVVPVIGRNGAEIAAIFDPTRDPTPENAAKRPVAGVFDGKKLLYGRTRRDLLAGLVGHTWIAVIGLALGPTVVMLRSLRRVGHRRRATVRSLLWIVGFVFVAIPAFLVDVDADTVPMKWIGYLALALATIETVTLIGSRKARH
jgi:hypothetical protein